MRFGGLAILVGIACVACVDTTEVVCANGSVCPAEYACTSHSGCLSPGQRDACAGLADDMGDGIEISREMIASGAALERLRLLQKASQA